MDQGFLLRAQRMLDQRQPARVDLGMLTASVAAQQAASPAARAQARGAGSRRQGGADALVELILAGPAWRDAAAARGGCFSRAGAGQGGKSA